MIEGMDKVVREHRFFSGLGEDVIQLVAGCARNVRFDAGKYLYHEGDPADEFFLIRQGRVALEMASPGRAAVTFRTEPEGDVVGLSWLIPPYHWAYDARALDLVRAIGIDAKCLRGKCESDHDFGYAMMMRFVPVLVERLQATQLQVLDVYGTTR